MNQISATSENEISVEIGFYALNLLQVHREGIVLPSSDLMSK